MPTPDALTIEELRPYRIGQGKERICFRNPRNPKSVLKLSPVGKTKQTDREVAYFRQLQRRNVPFTHLPQFFGTLSVPGYFGIEQELILDYDGSVSRHFHDVVAHPKGGVALSKQQIVDTLEPLGNYLIEFGISTCDLGRTNIVFQEQSPGRFRAVLIDGIGDTDFLPFSRWLPFVARRKIRRHWSKFMSTKALVGVADV